jgi:hypothetical protein
MFKRWLVFTAGFVFLASAAAAVYAWPSDAAQGWILLMIGSYVAVWLTGGSDSNSAVFQPSPLGTYGSDDDDDGPLTVGTESEEDFLARERAEEWTEAHH